jgi:hypothetical protein
MIEYPGRYVVYMDNWEGDILTRKIVFVAETAEEYGTKLTELDPEIREQIKITFTPEADEEIADPTPSLP